MKKNSFINDSIISITGIVLCKVIGLLYVIPFYAMISTSGGALYSYAYSIYALFLSLSTSGIPASISKIVSEYKTLGYTHTKVQVYKLGAYLISLLGIVAFVLMMIFAKPLAYLLIGNLQGGNSVDDIAFVVRTISTALLVVPILSVTKGYFQGQKQFKYASIANVIEQLARVAFLLLGCYLILNKFKLDEKYAIGASVFAATVGAFVAYLFLFIKMKKEKKEPGRNIVMPEEKKIDNKYLIRQIISIAIPFIIIDLLKSAYGMVDALTVVRGLTYLGYDANIAELALSVFATWAPKLTMIVISISLGLTISLIPNLAADNIKGDKEKVNHKINLSIIAIIFLTLPMCIGLSFLGRPIWILFYSFDKVSIDIFKLFIFTAGSFAIYSVIINIAQTLGHTKQVLTTMLVAFILNLVGNIPWMFLCNFIGVEAYHGATISTLITELGPALYLLLYLKKKHSLKFRETFNKGIKVLICNIIMFIGLLLVSKIYPIDSLTRNEAFIELIIYMGIGIILYLITGILTGTIKDILNERKR